MKRNHHLKELIDNIKKTEDLIVLHKSAGTPSLMLEQYEAIKARQISELIDGLSNDYKLIPGMKAILDERLLEDEETYLNK